LGGSRTEDDLDDGSEYGFDDGSKDGFDDGSEHGLDDGSKDSLDDGSKVGSDLVEEWLFLLLARNIGWKMARETTWTTAPNMVGRWLLLLSPVQSTVGMDCCYCCSYCFLIFGSIRCSILLLLLEDGSEYGFDDGSEDGLDDGSKDGLDEGSKDGFRFGAVAIARAYR